MQTKEKLLKSIKEAKNIFDKTLLNKSFLYIYKNKITSQIEFFEMKCSKNNFLHLTGVETKLNGKMFYSALDENKLSLEEIDYKSNGTTRLKLDIFSRLPLLFNSAIQVCFQDEFFTLKLKVDIMINKTRLDQKDIILGLKKDKKYNFYVPASILKKEPREIGENFSQVLCVLEKNRNDINYQKIIYNVKTIEIMEVLKYIPKDVINISNMI